jgi:hypothetical protein
MALLWWSRPLPALRHGRAPEFAGPDDEGVVENAALLQVGDQGHAGAVDFLGLQRDAVLDAAVVVPVLVVELDETHAALGQTAGEKAVRGEGSVARLAAVELQRLRVFSCKSISPARSPASEKAISYCAMRVATSGSSTRDSWRRLSALIAVTSAP